MKADPLLHSSLVAARWLMLGVLCGCKQAARIRKTRGGIRLLQTAADKPQDDARPFPAPPHAMRIVRAPCVPAP